jgi:hypothetical protein
MIWVQDPKMIPCLSHRIGGSLMEVGDLRGLLRGEDLHKALVKGVKGEGPCDVVMEAEGIVLGENKDRTEIGIDAVGNGNIDQTVHSPKGNRGLGPFTGEGLQAGAFSASQNKGDD